MAAAEEDVFEDIGAEAEAEMPAEVEDADDEIARLEAELMDAEQDRENLKTEGDEAAQVLAKNVEATIDKAKMAADAAAAQAERDSRSVFVNNVDFSITATELSEFFGLCGAVNTVKILLDRFSARPRGAAYVEFATEDGVENALALNGTSLKDRQLSINRKRTNLPTHVRGRGRGRGGGSSRGGFRGGRGGGGRGGFRGSSRGRGRGRGRGGW
jgi:polyadenylate-binding protein 2